MNTTRARLLGLLAGLTLVAGLPLAGKWLRRHRSSRCALDGLTIEPLYRVRVVEQGESHSFCCVRCAAGWLARRGRQPDAVLVTDETSGAELDARSVFFVHSPVVTNPITGNRVHAFASRAEAEEHARGFGGVVLTGPDRPFGRGR
jgi:hypothetical protein